MQKPANASLISNCMIQKALCAKYSQKIGGFSKTTAILPAPSPEKRPVATVHHDGRPEGSNTNGITPDYPSYSPGAALADTTKKFTDILIYCQETCPELIDIIHTSHLHSHNVIYWPNGFSPKLAKYDTQAAKWALSQKQVQNVRSLQANIKLTIWQSKTSSMNNQTF